MLLDAKRWIFRNLSASRISEFCLCLFLSFPDLFLFCDIFLYFRPLLITAAIVYVETVVCYDLTCDLISKAHTRFDAMAQKFWSTRRRTVAMILDMKAEKQALAFLNLFAVQWTLHHVGRVLYLDISLILDCLFSFKIRSLDRASSMNGSV